MRKILLISDKVPHYRVSVYNYLHRRFRDEDREFCVASEGVHSKSRDQIRFPFHEVPYTFARYRRLINTLQPEVVIFHLLLKQRIFWQLIHWVNLKRIPVICWTKGANLDKPDSRLRYHLFNYFHSLSDGLILYSKNQIPLVKPANRGKVVVANNTVNFEDYPQVQESKEEIRREFNIPFQKIVLFTGTMGIDGERKKVDHLINIFRDLDRSDVGLILVGSGMTEERKARINPKTTLYLGEVQDQKNLQISKLFKAADVFAIPGHVGLALNQAFFWGVPVVTEHGLHPPEIQNLQDGRNGFIVPENDLAELKNKILLLLDDDELRSKFSQNARDDILKNASIEQMFTAFKSAVERVKGSKARTDSKVRTQVSLS